MRNGNANISCNEQITLIIILNVPRLDVAFLFFSFQLGFIEVICIHHLYLALRSTWFHCIRKRSGSIEDCNEKGEGRWVTAFSADSKLHLMKQTLGHLDSLLEDWAIAKS